VRSLSALAIAFAAAAGAVLTSVRQPSAPESRVDAIMAQWSASTPGCAVGVSRGGTSVLERAYGMADLEHDVANRADTIFEAGSVSKQFTAAAVALLARAGKLSLDDPARKYIPELPEYGTPLTIRHMLTHTSGLRDWGSVAAISGWPRTSRVHTHAHVLDIVSRQRALNFTPGTRWSYSNSGYNLAAILVARVSGQSFAQFTQAQIFAPLGMTRTSWRDDYTRIVKDRAIAYSASAGRFSTEMPFENVHGNGGLLTTVGDLLRWTNNFSKPVVGDAAFLDAMREPGRFADGRRHDYALGIRVRERRGVRETWHSGATAGYRAYLSEYPDRRLVVAVLCNVSTANAEQLAHDIGDAYLGAPASADPPSSGPAPSDAAPEPADSLAGMYRRVDTGEPIRLTRSGRELRLGDRIPLAAKSATAFTRATGEVYAFGSNGTLTVTDSFGSVQRYARIAAGEAAAKPLSDYAGTYESDEAEVSMAAAVVDGALVLRRRPDAVLRLTPVYADAFESPMGFIRFHRDPTGRITAFGVTNDRVWDLRFTRR
jgi:CubicO group peptidase (beta-lactamase class C family)